MPSPMTGVSMDLESLISRLREAVARYGLPLVVHLIYPDGRTELITLPSDTMPANRQSAEVQQVVPELSEREKAALAVLARADQPLKGRTVATRAGIRYTSHFREMMSGLVNRELVVVAAGGGYWPADRPLPRPGDR
jgi:hypothetical protein